ncbi:MAG: hypothetical protein J0I04_16290 [Paenarthrobacter ureafaciens]|uniref:hypothetical protein n=1 Tax=Paenarthrobacter ureafaciens TaxID=37931 RepID=UPI001ACACD5D|nr:hypothetical protein [Paenarthrobacter ureafaciens]MBN9131191.1 hypothetical protein [Paenarthrobacter ureafaciens]
MGLSGQVVVERAGRPGAAAANGGGPPGAGDLPSKYPSGGGGVVEDVMEALEDGAAVLETARALALPAGRVFDIQEAADFAARVEALSRSIGYLQIIAAHAVERTRTEAKHNPAKTVPGWRTGWTETPHPAHAHTPGTTAVPDPGVTVPDTRAGSGSVLSSGAGTEACARAGRPVSGAGAVLGAVVGPGLSRLLSRGLVRCSMTGSATPPSSCAPGSGSISAKPAAA